MNHSQNKPMKNGITLKGIIYCYGKNYTVITMALITSI